MPVATGLTQWTPTRIKELLATNDVAVEQALLALYDRQTRDEQLSAITTHQNGMGFSGPDAEFLTSLSQWILRSTRAKGQRLTPKQMTAARKRLVKYAGQLVKVAEEKALALAPQSVGPAAPVEVEAACDRCRASGFIEDYDGLEYNELRCPACGGAGKVMRAA